MPSPDTKNPVTELLGALSSGDPNAAEQLFPLVYDELRRVASNALRARTPNQTLQATALVHEAYLRLLGNHNPKWQDRRYFFGTAARAMRRILLERARARRRPKHGGDRDRQPMTDVALDSVPIDDADWEAIDAAVEVFTGVDPDAAEAFQLHYYAGLSVEQAALALERSESTVKRDLRYARAWLTDRLKSPN